MGARKLNKITVFVQIKFTSRLTDFILMIVSVQSFEVDFFLEDIYRRLTLLVYTYVNTNHLSIIFTKN